MTNDHKPLTQDRVSAIKGYMSGDGEFQPCEVTLIVGKDVRSAVEGLKRNFYAGSDWQELSPEDYEYVLHLIDKWFPAFKDTSNTSYANGGRQ